MAFYMKPGQGPKVKTGNGLPSDLMGGPKMKSCGGPMMTDPKDEKRRPVKATVNSTTEDLGRGARRTTINTTSEFSKPKGKDLGADYKPSKAETARANKQRKLDKESKTTVVTSKGVKDVSSSTPSTELMKRRKQPAKPAKASNGFYSYGSNEANMNFGGKTTYAYSKKTPVGDKSYTVSPSDVGSKNKSGKPNTFKTRELTDREVNVRKSKFSNKNRNPYEDGEVKWNKYLTSVEGAEKKYQTKVTARNERLSSIESKKVIKRAALKAKQDAKRAQMKASKQSKKK